MSTEDDEIRELSLNPFALELRRRRVEIISGGAVSSDDEEPVDENGLNASERAACESLGCAPADFVTLRSRGRV